MESKLKGCEEVKEECFYSDEEPVQGDEITPGYDSTYEEGECPSRFQENLELSDDEWKPEVKTSNKGPKEGKTKLPAKIALLQEEQRKV